MSLSSRTIKRFDQVSAIFDPKITDDLKPDVKELIGARLRFEAMWEIEHGVYAGDWAMVIKDKGLMTTFGWVPSRDLRDITYA